MTDDEFELLRVRLKHGIEIKPKKNDIFALADLYDQINEKGLCKENQSSVHYLKNTLRAFISETLYGKMSPSQNQRLGNSSPNRQFREFFTSSESLFADQNKFQETEKYFMLTQLSICKNI